jgi:hypothetical protein
MMEDSIHEVEEQMLKNMSAELANLESTSQLQLEMEDLEADGKLFETEAEEVESVEYHAYLQAKMMYYCGIFIVFGAIIGIAVHLFMPNSKRKLLKKYALHTNIFETQNENANAQNLFSQRTAQNQKLIEKNKLT